MVLFGRNLRIRLILAHEEITVITYSSIFTNSFGTQDNPAHGVWGSFCSLSRIFLAPDQAALMLPFLQTVFLLPFFYFIITDFL